MNHTGARSWTIMKPCGLRLWYLPTAVLALGLLSIAMLIGSNRISERQLSGFILADAVMDIQTHAANAHLWLEEALSGDQSVNLDKVWSDFALVKDLTEAIHVGGKTENGLHLSPPEDRGIEIKAAEIGDLFSDLHQIALLRYRESNASGIGSSLDKRFDEAFEAFQRKAFNLERMVEDDLFRNRERSRRLFFSILFSWIGLLAAATAGLWIRERRRAAAESALQEAIAQLQLKTEELNHHRDHLQELVEARTTELTAANRNLRNEIVERIRAEEEAMRASHLASLGELAAGVAHEINSPVNGVINCAQLLADESKRKNEDPDIANMIIKEGRHIAGIVKSLLSFARERKGGRDRVRLRDLLMDCFELTEAQLRKDGIVLQKEVSETMPEIEADSQQIQQVFVNLINNARYALNRKYRGRDENKILKITAQEVTPDGSRHVRVSVFDTGAGIPPHHLHKVIMPFFTTKPMGEGTGLGLSISHGIVSDHGGKLLIDSRHGEYTRVDVLLPVKAEK